MTDREQARAAILLVRAKALFDKLDAGGVPFFMSAADRMVFRNLHKEVTAYLNHENEKEGTNNEHGN